MNRYFLYFLLFPFSMLITENVLAQKRTMPLLKWANIAQLPNENGQPSLGFAGAINGFTNQVLVVAGGANFPDKMPWEQGKKYYAKAIHVLQKIGGNWVWDEKFKGELPEPIAYCGNTVTDLGIVYAGGENEKGLSDQVYLLNYKALNHTVAIKKLPNLPNALTNIGLTSIGNTVYAVGGDAQKTSSHQFLCLDLASKTPEWNVLPNLPTALANSVTVAQQKDGNNYIYVIGGRSKTESGISNLQHSTFAFDVKNQVWKKMAALTDGQQVTNLAAASGIAIGKNHILITGGDNGKVFHQIEIYLNQIANAKTAEVAARLTKEKNQLVIHHKGFYKGVLLYSTHTNSWRKLGELPFLAPVTTTATKYGNAVLLSNGEIKPGIRTPNVMLGEFNHLQF